jgi:hypothetical protein
VPDALMGFGHQFFPVIIVNNAVAFSGMNVF